MTYFPVSRDRRYTVTYDHINGAAHYVARFQGAAIAMCSNYPAAAGRAIGAHSIANGAEVIVGRPAIVRPID